MTDLLDRINRLSESQRRLLRLRVDRMGWNRAGDPRLVGYAVPQGDGVVTAHDLREFLKGRLPDYMVPASWVVLESFPMTTQGKVDRKALSAMNRLASQAVEQGMPRTDSERAIAAVWGEVLGLRAVGFHDNFFDLGGHSLLLPKVLTKIRGFTTRDVSMVDLFRYPTVQALATYLGAESSPTIEQQAMQDLKDKHTAGAHRLAQRRARKAI
ncbi:MAG: hypothetical protein KF693_02565 [Nitrospira sp.]|nr:hypothetical protein [Nitrospira sp.]